MSNKDMPKGKLSPQKAYAIIDRIFQSENIRKIEEEKKQAKLRDLKDFTMAALTGLCANGEMAAFGSLGVAKIAVEAAEAALAELEGRG
jgi:hypothetical protein